MASGVSRRSFSRVIKPGPFLTKKRQIVNGLVVKTDYNWQPYEVEEKEEETNKLQAILTGKLRKKYYGRKVRQISSPPQASFLAHYSKYVLNATWSEKYWADEDFLRRKTTHNIKTSLSLKSLGDYVFVDQGIKLSQKDIFKMVQACDSKTSIRLDNCTSLTLKKWKKLPSYTKSLVKHLGLEIVYKVDEQVNPKGWFKGFDQLKSFALNKNSGALDEVLSELLQVKSLKVLYLEIYYGNYTGIGLDNLINEIEARKISKWHIKIRTEYEEIMHEKYDGVLSIIDCLGLGKVQLKDSFGGPPDFNFRTEYSVRSTFGFYDLKYLHEKRKKILEIAIIEHTRFDLGCFLNRCKSLQGLYIKSNAYEFTTIFQEPKTEALQKPANTSSWTSHLKDVVLSFTEPSSLETQFEDLATKIKVECPNLETLELFSCYNANDNQYSEVEEGQLEARNLSFCLINPNLEGLKRLTSLQYLRLAWNIGFEYLQETIGQLPNLKRLELTLGDPEYARKGKPWDQNVSFSSLQRLTELKIHKVCSDSEEWGEGFLNNLQYLQGLQVLEFKDSTESTMSLEMLRLLISGFVSLKNLKRLVLDVHVTEVETSNANVRKGGEPQEQDEVIEGIKALITQYVKSNTNLEELQISELETFEIERIKYIGY